jgi:hypothetical protein
MNIVAATRRYDRTTDPQKRRLIALDVAIALHDANKDPTEWLRRYAADRLAQFDTPNNLFKNHLQVGGWPCCEACKAIDGKSFVLESARASLLLPQPCCTYRVNKAGFACCSCDWEIDMDSLKTARH